MAKKIFSQIIKNARYLLQALYVNKNTNRTLNYIHLLDIILISTDTDIDLVLQVCETSRHYLL